jgi:two-component system NarL family response regulator
MTAGVFDEREPIRVVIADSDCATRTGVKLALQEAGIDVCDEVASARDLIESVARLDPDVCLVDVGLPGGGITAASELAGTRRPATIMLAEEVVEEDFRTAMRMGAAGFLPKNVSPSRLPAVVRSVLAGEPAVPRALVGMLLEDVRRRARRRQLVGRDHRAVDLTSREWEVLDLMRERLSTREIATRLSISDVTVRRHIGSVLKKLRVGSRAAAIELLRSA